MSKLGLKVSLSPVFPFHLAPERVYHVTTSPWDERRSLPLRYELRRDWATSPYFSRFSPVAKAMGDSIVSVALSLDFDLILRSSIPTPQDLILSLVAVSNFPFQCILRYKGCSDFPRGRERSRSHPMHLDDGEDIIDSGVCQWYLIG